MTCCKYASATALSQYLYHCIQCPICASLSGAPSSALIWSRSSLSPESSLSNTGINRSTQEGWCTNDYINKWVYFVFLLQAIELRPDWPKAYARLGAACMGMESFMEAKTAYEKAFELEPTNASYEAYANQYARAEFPTILAIFIWTKFRGLARK